MRWIDFAILIEVTGCWKRNFVGCGSVVGATIALQTALPTSSLSSKGETAGASLDSGLEVESLFCVFGALDDSGGGSVGV